MRRAAPVAFAAFGALAVAVPARAAPWSVTAEAGAEVDTNVQRVEDGPPDQPQPITAPVARFGVHAEHRSSIAGGAYGLAIGDLTRLVADSTVPGENVTVLSGDLRWLHPIGTRPVSLGFGVDGIDALALTDPVGDRTFDTAGASAVLAIHATEPYHLVLAAGARGFAYKPDHNFDWTGPAATARFDMTLWQPAERTKSLDLAATLELQAREYNAHALVNTCAPGAMPDPSCLAPTDLRRRDRYQSAGVEVTYVGREVASLGYQLMVIDSSSAGESFARHRVTASGTVQLGSYYTTLLAILQIDQYLDGLLVQSDIEHQTFTDVEDDSRSSLQLRVARKLGPDWSLEGRAAIWRDIGTAQELRFERELVYFGVVYAR